LATSGAGACHLTRPGRKLKPLPRQTHLASRFEKARKARKDHPSMSAHFTKLRRKSALSDCPILH